MNGEDLYIYQEENHSQTINVLLCIFEHKTRKTVWT